MTVYNWNFYTPPDPRGYNHNDVMILPDGSRWILSQGEGWTRTFLNIDPTTGSVVGLVGPDGGGAPLATSRYQSAIPMVLPSSGSVAANGALTLTTSLPLSGGYSWGCYMYFPANVVFSGSEAGLYFVIMSANNAGTIYADRYTGGNPTIPTSPTPIVAAGPGAYTQTTSPIDLLTQTIGANTMGRNGRIIHQPAFVYPNNANSKVLSTVFGSSNVYGKTRTTATQDTPLIDIRNRGVTNRQFSAWANSALPATASTSGVLNIAVDTTVDVPLITRGQLAAATDYIIVESSSVEVTPF